MNTNKLPSFDEITNMA
ncbi:MAG: hypothetical protein QG556_582, partial [Pseudomonadota bacterium]|nr:hypothetical protein [Pseudomonadota bacterium]